MGVFRFRGTYNPLSAYPEVKPRALDVKVFPNKDFLWLCSLLMHLPHQL